MNTNTVEQRGFTLLEMIVVVIIFGILTAMVTRAYPLVREKQQLTLAQQEVQSLVREAQRRAFNEEREETCLPGATDRVPCSDIGLFFEHSSVTMFADLDSNNVYDRLTDFSIPGKVAALPSGARVPMPQTLIFRATPPNSTLYANGGEVITAPLTLAAGTSTAMIEISRYGIIERK